MEMEKIIQEFRIIETDDGFRIEIKGDKEELREFVMSLDPRNWPRHKWGPWDGPWSWQPKRGQRRRGGRFPFGPGAFFGFGPWGWGDEEDDEGEDDDPPRRKRKGPHHHGSHGPHDEDETV
jgi:hypothetical protein